MSFDSCISSVVMLHSWNLVSFSDCQYIFTRFEKYYTCADKQNSTDTDIFRPVTLTFMALKYLVKMVKYAFKGCSRGGGGDNALCTLIWLFLILRLQSLLRVLFFLISLWPLVASSFSRETATFACWSWSDLLGDRSLDQSGAACDVNEILLFSSGSSHALSLLSIIYINACPIYPDCFIVKFEDTLVIVYLHNNVNSLHGPVIEELDSYLDNNMSEIKTLYCVLDKIWDFRVVL